MTTLDTRPGRVDVHVHPGNAVVLRFRWPEALTGRTFTAALGTASLGCEVSATDVTVTATEAQTADLDASTSWKLTETTSGTQDRIVGQFIPDPEGTGDQDATVTVVEDEATITVTVLGEPGPEGPEGPAGGGGGGGTVDSVVAGTGVDVDATDPANPIVAIESGVYRSGGTDVAVADGGTGASTAAGARTNLGLGTAAVEDTSAFDPAGSAAAAQAAAVQRANHTGTQLAATISDLTEAIQDAVGAMATDSATVNFTYDDTVGTLTAVVQGLTSASLSDFAEAVDDRVAALLVAGTNVTLTYNDVAGTLTIDVTGAGSYTNEEAQDAVGTILVDTATIDFTYDDVTPQITADVKAGSITAAHVAADVATQAELDAHVNDTTAAHAASAVSIADAGNDFTATDVEGALAELQADHEADAADLAAHLADTSDAHDASAISFAPAGAIAATDVQAAVAEVATDAASALSTHEADTTSVHGIPDTSTLYAAGGTDVAVADGGTGASTAAGARANLGAVALEDWTDLANLGATEAISAADDTIVRRKGTLDQNCTITLTTAADQQLDLLLVQDATGGRAATFVGVDVWVTQGGTAPDLSTRAAGDVDRFWFEDIAGTCYGYWLTESVAAARTLVAVIDGGGSAITTGAKKAYIYVPFDCTITGVVMLADQSGSIVVDIWRDSYANYPATDADSITASAPPTITTATKSKDTTLTGWTKALSADDILEFNVDSAATVTKVYVILTVRPR